MPAAVIFDLDGVLMDSEQRWNGAKEALVREAGGEWREDAPSMMMGMSSPEWAAYLRDSLGVPMDVDAISRDVVRRMEEGYRESLPLLPGADDAVRALAERWPLGLASSSNLEVIDLVLELARFGGAFGVTVSSEEVARGKPAPDVYLETARRLGVEAGQCVAIEDSSNGLRSAHAAGMAVIAVPNPHYPPVADALALAAVTVGGVDEVTPELIERAASEAPVATIRDALLELHRRLLETQRIQAERFGGRMSSSELLQAAADDLRFAWLKQLSELISELDHARAEGDAAASGAAIRRARELLAPPDAETAFGARYLRALQDHPDVVLAHRDVTAALEAGA